MPGLHGPACSGDRRSCRWDAPTRNIYLASHHSSPKWKVVVDCRNQHCGFSSISRGRVCCPTTPTWTAFARHWHVWRLHNVLNICCRCGWIGGNTTVRDSRRVCGSEQHWVTCGRCRSRAATATLWRLSGASLAISPLSISRTIGKRCQDEALTMKREASTVVAEMQK
eukprot:COSAG02_NODE_9701_length_2137_cov_5.145731_2_plen_168_part_00